MKSRFRLDSCLISVALSSFPSHVTVREHAGLDRIPDAQGQRGLPQAIGAPVPSKTRRGTYPEHMVAVGDVSQLICRPQVYFDRCRVRVRGCTMLVWLPRPCLVSDSCVIGSWAFRARYITTWRCDAAPPDIFLDTCPIPKSSKILNLLRSPTSVIGGTCSHDLIQRGIWVSIGNLIPK